MRNSPDTSGAEAPIDIGSASPAPANATQCQPTRYLGAPTVCVFGGSHQRAEWRPLGSKVVLVSRAIRCSPCHFDHAGFSPYAKACLREIGPETVALAAVAAMKRVDEPRVEAHL